MLDKKSHAVLKVLNKLTEGNTYKVVSGDDILSNLTQKSIYDREIIKQIIEFLEKQQYINIKFSEENTYCYSLLPKARIYLEQDIVKPQNNKKKFDIMNYVYVMIASFIGAMLAMLVFFYLTF